MRICRSQSACLCILCRRELSGPGQGSQPFLYQQRAVDVHCFWRVLELAAKNCCVGMQVHTYLLCIPCSMSSVHWHMHAYIPKCTGVHIRKACMNSNIVWHFIVACVTCMPTYILTYKLTHTQTHTRTHTHIHRHIRTCIHTHISTFQQTHIDSKIHTYIRTYKDTHINTFTHTYIRTNIHAYIHICIHLLSRIPFSLLA
jgi:hypothetical protein